jgi:nitrate reductase gamma subunit
MAALLIVTYVLFSIFLVAFIWKGYQQSKMPIHLRWELYPLAGEKSRPWGGSYLESPDWYKKPREHHSFAGEMAFLGKEVFFFREYFRRNRSLWYIVYPFHMGIILLVTFFVLVVVGALTTIGGVEVSAASSNAWGLLLYYVTLIVGIPALVLGTISCLALLIRKFADPTMSPYTRRAEYFNIVFVLAMFLTGLLAWAVADRGFEIAREYMKSLLTFGSTESLPSLSAAHAMLLTLLLAYLPFTNMMHFFAKFFTYHKVRWDDRPNLRGSALERELKQLLEQRINWAAPHMQNLRRWVDVSTEETGASPSPRVTRKGGE